EDESGSLIHLQLGPDGSILDLEIPDLGDTVETVTDTVENTTEQVTGGGGAGDAVGQVADQATGAVGQVADQAGQAAQGAQDTAGQAAGQAQDAAGGATEQAQDAAEEVDATEAAKQKADELGVDLSQIEGSGAGGRITVKDVVSAANQG
ncbi:MAG TPA: E3 binding domain-containing protein, partial [Rubrobacter sp.]